MGKLDKVKIYLLNSYVIIPNISALLKRSPKTMPPKKEVKRKATKDDKPAKKSKPEKPVGKSKSESSAKQSKSKKADATLKTGTYLGTNGTYVYDGTVLFEDEEVGQRDGYAETIPKKNSDG